MLENTPPGAPGSVDVASLVNRLKRCSARLAGSRGLRGEGRVTRVVGTIVEARGTAAPTGASCRILTRDGAVDAEVVGFQERGLQLLPLGRTDGIAAGDRVVVTADRTLAGCSEELKGRVIDAQGLPLDGGPAVRAREWRPVYAPPPSPLARRRISQPLQTGVRAIDGLLTLARGQRMGLFAGSGVGKSTLLGMLARNGKADVNVVALVGERGREVAEFLERDLGPEGRQRSVIVVATSDAPAPLRIRAALLATTLAEFFRDRGLDVCLMMDSLTRVALAQREIGLATGEPPTTRGYTPSVFSLLPQLLERAGAASRGSITGLYTVLVEGDDMMEPVADVARSILDGHVVLSRRLAERGHFPAIDVLASVSRVMPDVISPPHAAGASRARGALSVLDGARDLLELGAYAPGSNPLLDRALGWEASLRDFLVQAPSVAQPLDETVQLLARYLDEEFEGEMGTVGDA